MANGRFEPGADPRRNAGGRPKAVAEVQALARAETSANIAALIRVRDTSEVPAAVVAATKELLDRAWGKAPQAITGADGGDLSIMLVTGVVRDGKISAD